MWKPEPILCAPLLREVDTALAALLASLDAADWDRPTIAGAWTVRDVAAHLLDTQLRKLSLARDGCFVEKPVIQCEADLIAFVNRLNREGAAVYRRLSPRLLCLMLETASAESAAFHESLDPFARATFPVSWAGESESLNWFDTARELTERWHHQQQIRLAANRPGLMDRRFLFPVLDCFLRALPHAYRTVSANEGVIVNVRIEGDAGGLWSIRHGPDGWIWNDPAQGTPACRIQIPQSTAWRLFTKGISREEAEVQVDGDRELAGPLLGLRAVVG
jgi:uncharacterized protein (TIGR03083 family)